jgi:hypothetical protein
VAHHNITAKTLDFSATMPAKRVLTTNPARRQECTRISRTEVQIGGSNRKRVSKLWSFCLFFHPISVDPSRLSVTLPVPPEAPGIPDQAKDHSMGRDIFDDGDRRNACPTRRIAGTGQFLTAGLKINPAFRAEDS